MKIEVAKSILQNTLRNQDELTQEAIKTVLAELNKPMSRVEVIDDCTQKFNGHIYRKEKHGYYTRREYLHIAVMEHHTGEVVPKDCEVHHNYQNKNGDWDKDENNIENLQMLSKLEHKQVHNDSAKQTTYICSNCGKEFKSRKHDCDKHFCKPSCQTRYYEKKVTVTCVICNKKFVTRNRGKDTATTCSSQCRGILSQMNRAARGRLNNHRANGQFARKNEIL